MRYILSIVLGLLVGICIGYTVILLPNPLHSDKNQSLTSSNSLKQTKKQVIGFLPYWLLSKVSDDYSSVITQLAYFSLSIDTDGHIKKLTSPIEEEPGWYTLHSGKMDDIFSQARNKNKELSLTVFSGDNDTIDELMTDPKNHADALVSDISPLLKSYHFSDLNVDIEKVKEASNSAQEDFITFLKEVKHGLQSTNTTLTVDISSGDLIRHDLIQPEKISNIADFILVMAYDYHFAGSYVTGPVAPLYGAGVESEYDTNAAINEVLKTIPPEKIILGIPSYGYEWETLDDTPRSAVIPETGLTASSKRVESLLSTCTTCITKTDETADESYVLYQDEKTSTYHQLFYPTVSSTKAKVQYAQTKKIGGLAVWALGYENSDVLTPLSSYLNQ